ncbi:Ribose transport system permease protein RbsC [Aquisphaera giovannonii]|uniref:Ribose transport system permease protein RbsC n=1 Tax=Aquisphaera giovannonii TaxID=406548 RepID=A0A5B9W578_9BACT|nr:ABC transporter permease [Aquisphaera giovannonii]QEH35181.1 Ribose transport system permease protein RbsC [Aquisphaera giovannonii]
MTAEPTEALPATGPRPGPWRRLARHAPLLLLLAVVLAFGAISPVFRTPANARNILVQSSGVAVVAVGMTIVLITGGIDLSAGAVMFLSAAVAGKLVIGGWIPGLGPIPVPLAVALIVPLGLACGLVNAALVAGGRIAPFVATLATLYLARGLALQITQTRPLPLPPGFLELGRAAVLGLPLPAWILLAAAAAGQAMLSATPLGRQLYALGHDPDAARRAGLRTTRLLAFAYVISGLCASLGGLIAVAQLGTVSPTFGAQREFAAIAAAVLGGTSLFGGRGNVLPGTLVGVLLVQTLENGLNILNADPYSYPVVVGAVLFVAVLLDRLRRPRD